MSHLIPINKCIKIYIFRKIHKGTKLMNDEFRPTHSV